jgi:dTDP-4-dehydrorhamnose reductase
MSILILGAAGNLGGQLRLAFADQKPVSWDRKNDPLNIRINQI